MKTRVKPDWILIAICLIVVLIYFSGISSIPFHPDESTQLAMSADFETLLKQPGLLIWNSGQPAESPQTYRLLDAPLTRYLLGFGRALASLPPSSGFWDWSKDWQANLDQGAYPDIQTLLAGRLAISFLFPISLLFLYLSARGIGGEIAGYSAIILLGLNAIVLLHTRRAMAEGPLLLGITAVMASWQIAPRRPWVAGLAMAIAFNAKQSSLALFPIGILAVSWVTAGSQRRTVRIFGNIIQYILVFSAITWLLNPVAWQQPWTVARVAAQARTALLSQQVADTQRLAPSQVLDRPPERAAVLLGHLYLTQPTFAEAENYRSHTITAEAVYLAKPFNNLGRNSLFAGLLLALTAFGLIASALRTRQRCSPEKRYFFLMLLGTLCMAGGLLLAVPLPWQRYILPLIPFACVWAGVGVSRLLQLFPLIQKSTRNLSLKSKMRTL
jgi:hypothetical protein